MRELGISGCNTQKILRWAREGGLAEMGDELRGCSGVLQHGERVGKVSGVSCEVSSHGRRARVPIWRRDTWKDFRKRKGEINTCAAEDKPETDCQEPERCFLCGHFIPRRGTPAFL